MSTNKNKIHEAGPISVRIVRPEEAELFQTDLAWKYVIPFHGKPQELAVYLYKLANWLSKYDDAREAQ